MNKLTILTVATGLVLFGAGIAGAQVQPATATSIGVMTQIIAPITITSVLPLAFGDIIPDPLSPGTVTVSPIPGDVARAVVQSLTESASPASFEVTGEAGASYSVTLPTGDTVFVNGEGLGDQMVVNSFQFYSANARSGEYGVLDGGTDVLTVGATINVGAAQAAGTYTGTFDVTVAYQ